MHNSTDNPTLRDLAQNATKAGSTAQAELIQRVIDNTGFLADVVFVPGNMGVDHEVKQITTLPDAAFVALYDGPAPSKGGGKVIKDSCGLCESIMEEDTRLVKKQGDEAAQARYLVRQKNQHVIAVANKVADCMFTGNHKTNPKEFTGIFPRLSVCGYNVTTNVNDEFAAGYTVVNGGKANSSRTDLRSAVLANWNTTGLHGFYDGCGGFSAGIKEDPVDTRWVESPAGGSYKVIIQRVSMSVGLSLADSRLAGRLANLSLYELANASKEECVKYVEWFKVMTSRVNTEGSGKVAWYVDRNLWTEIQNVMARADCLNGVQMVKNAYGEMEDTILGFPVRKVPALNINESRVA